MTLRSSHLTYGTLARGLHWVSAGLVVVLIALGLTVTRINSGDNTTLYRIHVTLGLLIAVLTIVRVIWRFTEPSPVPPPMPPASEAPHRHPLRPVCRTVRSGGDHCCWGRRRGSADRESASCWGRARLAYLPT